MFTRATFDHLVLRAVDAERLARFYCELFDASVERELDLGLLQIRLGAILIDIVPVDSELGKTGGPAPGPGKNLDHFCIRVDPFDVDAINARVNSIGGELSEVHERYGADGFGDSVYVTDPEGNTVELKGAPSRGPLS